MKKIRFQALWILLLSITLSCDDSNPAPNDEIIIPEGYSLTWQDEFNDETISSQNWQYENGDGTDFGLPPGWGNNELQIYTSESKNSSINKDGDNGALNITAIKEGDESYSSAKLVSKGLVSIRYGRVDVRAKMPQGQGIWPAIWLLGDNEDMIDWPGCGEIDIAEVLGHEPSTYYSTLHYTNGENKKGEIQGVQTLTSGSFSDSYHIFSIDWTPESITFLVDGTQVHEVALEEDMKEFQRSFYLKLNVAVGGYWPGNPDNTTQFPQTMAIDYIRLFTKDDFTPPEAPELNIEEETFGQIIEPNIGDNAIKEGFTDLGNLEVVAYGGGGEPSISTSETAIDGDLSLQYEFPGTTWGGAYIELTETKNLSSYSTLKFSLHAPASLTDGEIKLESPSTNKAIYLKDYTANAVSNGFVEYSIPLTDFEGLDLTELRIAFSIWNPLDIDGNFVQGPILIDNLHFEN